ncbi:ATP-dependent nuclease [Pseudoalteromonas sp. T1lg23B]|uniref:ATP-dependent nuclease n=1 Tax=Pseudoalteromonas sp. T1lg23B TaxID=2077097 RepID=UPI000CF6C9D4|nr:AAA family ATPase [Pseudoalteromonas sp. T1lg23B]
MEIKRFDIRNFRKLENVQVELSSGQTVFVGANNSGKTSAMDALIYFLDRDKYSGASRSGLGKSGRRLNVTDFTVSNWLKLNSIGEMWVDGNLSEAESLDEWVSLCPSVDVWLDASIADVVAVSHLIPTLDWNGEPLGVKLAFVPKNTESLRDKYIESFNKASTAIEGEDSQEFKLWPRSLKDFLSKELNRFFEIKGFLLPSEHQRAEASVDLRRELDSYPFSNLFKVNVIDAQRGFSDALSSKGLNKGESLSPLLSEYFDTHLNPNDLPDKEDVKALKAIDSAQTEFDNRLRSSFRSAIGEIENLGYPGFSDPHILLSSKLDPIESLSHEAAVKFSVGDSAPEALRAELELPENLNGLGYKNLIYMIFKLISFRDGWQLKGKARLKTDSSIEPLHLVLIEEPEAHLHAQVQQVFIRKAYEVLSNEVSDSFKTQMVVSSHSSYLAHEVDFDKLRYFKRLAAKDSFSVPTSEVMNLATVFSQDRRREPKELQTAKFVSRYIKTTHCDLFFANGIILVEGAAERVLLPHFIKNNYADTLYNSYISVLEVGGAHAHRLRSLIELLGMPTLIVTDADAKNGEGKKAQPELSEEFSTGSDTLNLWLGFDDKNFKEIVELPFSAKQKGNVCAVYQNKTEVREFDNQIAIPYTFEDAFALANISTLKELESATGMLSHMKDACDEKTLDECATAMFKALEKGQKAKMALDILYEIEPEKLSVPDYIAEGLDWLSGAILSETKEFPVSSGEGHEN